MHVIYHHRTRGQAVEGVHIRSIIAALQNCNVNVETVSPPGISPHGESAGSGRPEAPNSSKRTGVLEWISKQAPEAIFEVCELLYNFIAGWRLYWKARKNKPNFVYERYSLFMFAGVLVCRWLRVPIFLEINDSALVQRVRPLLFSRLAIWIESWTLRHADGLVFISSYFRDIALKSYGELPKTIISPNAADIAVFSPDQINRQQTREQYGLADKVVCGFVGAFLPWHGIDDFLKKALPFLDEHPSLAFLLVGDGPQYEATRQLVSQTGLEDRVTFTGRVPHSKVPMLMSGMDFAILPDSNLYGSPMKLFESMAMGVAMVCPAYPPIQEVVSHDRTGWLFPPGQLEQAVSLSLRLSNRPEEVRAIGKAARRYIVAERQWSDNVKALLQMYEGLEKSSDAPPERTT